MFKFSAIIFFICLVLSCSTSAPTILTDNNLAQRTSSISSRLNVEANTVMNFWLKYGPDQEFGGFYGTLNRKGQAINSTDKGLIQQSRHLWTLSTWYQRRNHSNSIKTLADKSYQFIIDNMLDDDDEFYFKVSQSGEPIDRKKQLYAESFAIFALAEYALAFNHAEAANIALKCFKSIDKRAHDERYGGYDQSQDPGWLVQGAAKGTNTQIHLLEAFTALYRVTHHDHVKLRLEEMIHIITQKIVQEDTYAHMEFYRDWTPFSTPVVSYGHDLETAWLLMDALDALGIKDESVFTSIKRFGHHSAMRGYDEKMGGYFEEGLPLGRATKKEKIWWIQAEALPGLWQLYQLTGNEQYLSKMEGTLDWIERYQKDSTYGGWFWGVNENGTIGPRGENKGEEWKTNYHLIRALIFTADWIDEKMH